MWELKALQTKKHGPGFFILGKLKSWNTIAERDITNRILSWHDIRAFFFVYKAYLSLQMPRHCHVDGPNLGIFGRLPSQRVTLFMCFREKCIDAKNVIWGAFQRSSCVRDNTEMKETWKISKSQFHKATELFLAPFPLVGLCYFKYPRTGECPSRSGP